MAVPHAGERFRVRSTVVLFAALIAQCGSNPLPESSSDRGGGRGTHGISCGNQHFCKRFGADVVCVGAGSYGRLGTDSPDDLGDEPGEVFSAAPVPFPAHDYPHHSPDTYNYRGVHAVAAGGFHSCVLLDTYALRCFGLSAEARLGVVVSGGNSVGDQAGEMTAIADVAFLDDGFWALQVTAGYKHTCVLFSNGGVRCFGNAELGQTGSGSVDPFAGWGSPLAMSSLGYLAFSDSAAAEQVDAGYYHTCAVFAPGRVRCFGAGADGRLGTGSAANMGDEPGELTSLGYVGFSDDGHAAVQVAAGYAHTCVLFDNGGVRCFGAGGSGRLGSGSTNNVGLISGEMSTVDFIEFSEDGSVATQVAVGVYHTCALFDNGRVRCFGYNEHGQLGRDSSSSIGASPGQMSTLGYISFSDSARATQVAVGNGQYTCVLFDNGGARCFGINGHGQLGIGSTDSVGTSPGDMAALEYVPIMVLSLSVLEPASGNVAGGERLTLNGNGFVGVQDFAVRIRVADSGGECYAQPSGRNGTDLQESPIRAVITTPSFSCAPNTTVLVSVSRDGGAWSNEAPFILYRTPSVTAIEPRTGPVAGKTAVTVHGSAMIATPDALCRFGDATSPVVLFTSGAGPDGNTSTVVCASPPAENSAPGATSVSVALNGRNFSSSANPVDTLLFLYEDAQVTAVSVPRGPVGGGTRLNVTLNSTVAGLVLDRIGAPEQEGHVLVRFSSPPLVSMTVQGSLAAAPSDGAAVGSDFAIMCVTPDVSAFKGEKFFPRIFQVSVSLNFGVQFTDTHVPFEFFLSPSLISVVPNALPLDAASNHAISVIGTNFLDRTGITIRVGADSWNAGVRLPGALSADGDAVIALAPPGLADAAGPFMVSVSLNSGADFTSESLPLWFFAVVSVSPPGGPVKGATRVKVTGGGIVSSVNLACIFGTASPSAAVFISATMIECLSPLAAVESSAPVAVTVDGEIATSPGQVTFSYHPNSPAVTAVTPASGPSGAAGGVLTLHGEPGSSSFAGFGATQCRLGSEEVIAAAVTASSIVCPVVSGIGVVPIFVALNGIDFSPSVVGRFTLFNFFSLEPSHGPATGGTALTLTGGGYNSPSSSWVCRFGDPPGTLVEAAVISSAQMSCSSPPSSSESLAVALSADGGATFATGDSENTISFGYFAAPSVTAVFPASGPALTRTRVAVYGTNILAHDGVVAIMCRFGAANPATANVTSFSFDRGTDIAVHCDSPRATGLLPVEISLNGGVDFSSGGALYSFYELVGIDPPLAPSRGGTVVTVSGNGFSTSGLPQTRCRFGRGSSAVIVPASRFIDEMRIVCVSPELDPSVAKYPVGVTTDEATGFATLANVDLAVFAPPELTGFAPLAGPIAGGTTVTVRGTGLPTTVLDPLCLFGDSPVPAAILGDHMTCVSPERVSGTAPLAVSFNGKIGSGDLFVLPAGFAYFTVRSVEPLLGPEEGGTIVTVGGLGFSRDVSYSCVVDTDTAVHVRGQVLPSSLGLTCAIPPRQSLAPSRQRAQAPPGLVGNIEISVVSAGSERRSSAVTFQLYSPPIISAINPDSLPSSGGRVTLSGSGFVNTTSCRFVLHNRTVDAPRMEGTDSAVVCSAPPNAKAVNQSVLVTHNGQQFHGAEGGVLFTYTACNPGHFAAFDTDPCEPCPVGTYAREEASKKCEPCPGRNYTDVEGSPTCKGCPDNTSVRGGAADELSKCTCDPGTFHPEGKRGAPCIDCSLIEGAQCDGGTQVARARRGYWSARDTPFQFVACESEGACPGGGAGSCAKGHTGRMCAECLPGFFKSGASLCSPCPDAAPTILIAFGAFCLLLSVLLIKSVGGSAKEYAGTIGIATKYFQVLAIMGRLGVSWPERVTDAIGYMTAPFTFDASLLASECSVPAVTYGIKWVATLCLPVFFSVIFAIVYLALRVVASRRIDAEDRIASLTNRVINAFVLLLSLGYMTLVSTSLEFFGCTTQADGKITLNADPSLLCFDAWWWKLLPVALATTLAYGFGIPVTMGWWLRRNRDDVGEPDFAERFGALYAVYRPWFPYWEAVVMAEKFGIALVAVLLAGFVSLQLTLLGVIFVATLVAYTNRAPFQLAADNDLHFSLRWCSIITLGAGQAFHANDIPNETARLVMECMALALITGGTAIIFARVIMDLLRIRRENRVPIRGDLQQLMHKMFSPQGVTVVRCWLRSMPESELWQARLVHVLTAVANASISMRQATRRRSSRTKSLGRSVRSRSSSGPFKGKVELDSADADVERAASSSVDCEASSVDREDSPAATMFCVIPDGDPIQDPIVAQFCSNVWQSRMVPFLRIWITGLEPAADQESAEEAGCKPSNGETGARREFLRCFSQLASGCAVENAATSRADTISILREECDSSGIDDARAAEVHGLLCRLYGRNIRLLGARMDQTAPKVGLSPYAVIGSPAWADSLHKLHVSGWQCAPDKSALVPSSPPENVSRIETIHHDSAHLEASDRVEPGRGVEQDHAPIDPVPIEIEMVEIAPSPTLPARELEGREARVTHL